MYDITFVQEKSSGVVTNGESDDVRGGRVEPELVICNIDHLGDALQVSPKVFLFYK